MTIPPSFTVIGFDFHWYGLLIGLGLLGAWFVVSRRAEQVRRGKELLEGSLPWLVLGGLIGARLWHVITDWHLYQANLGAIWQVWQGGLSILGAIAGVLLAWFGYVRINKINKKDWWLVPDLIAFGAPMAQIVGRLGNWINQELVGFPTGLPWGVSIQVENRPVGYENFQYFHPLFAYEILALIFIWRWLWLKFKDKPELFGSGQVLLHYLGWYCLFRFFLDFLRLEKGPLLHLGNLNLGVNQLMLLFILTILGIYWWRMRMKEKRAGGYAMSTVLGLTLLVLIVAGVVWLFWHRLPFSQINVAQRMAIGVNSDETLDLGVLEQLQDHSRIKMTTATGLYEVEVVNTTQSIAQGLSGRAEIGADAMVFVFPNKAVRTFWMPDMKFGLDLVWVADGVITGVTESVPPPEPNEPLAQLKRYSSGQEVNMVIEVVSGQSDDLGLTQGAEVSFSGL